MDRLKKMLEKFREGTLALEDMIKEIRSLPFKDVGFARIDKQRELRCGFPEVIYCEGKTRDQVKEIAKEILKTSDSLIATRGDKKIYEAIKSITKDAKFYKEAKIIGVKKRKGKLSKGKILVITAGTSDIPVAEEARVTAVLMDNQVETLYDVGVAGIHRLFGDSEKILNANVIVVVAGMEGALASVVGGIVDKPVIAVPTSVGYGASFEGIAPLLTMLNSCAAGVAVVNIDNGFGAGYIASLINKLGSRE